jgi:hypothetical protein
MKLVRWFVVGGIVVALLPSDEKSQADLARKAAASAQYASTTCERHPDACAKAADLWASLKKKAQFAGRVIWDVAFNRSPAEPQDTRHDTKRAEGSAPARVPTQPMAPSPTAATSPAQAPKRETRIFDGTPKRETGTLRPIDRQIPWQGATRTP